MPIVGRSGRSPITGGVVGPQVGKGVHAVGSLGTVRGHAKVGGQDDTRQGLRVEGRGPVDPAAVTTVNIMSLRLLLQL